MVFSSLTFLCVFLPAVFLGYLVLPWMKARNALLILASLVFYAYGEPVYVFLMLISSLANWAFGMMIGAGSGAGSGVGSGAGSGKNSGKNSDENSGKRRSRKALVALAVIVNLGFLAVFKYAGMAAASLGVLMGGNPPFAALALPIGISFYTFQALSYVIDVYRGETLPQKSFARVLLFISFFPQLIAGPIIKYHDVEAQLAERTVTVDGIARGLRRFSVGLAKKVLIANTLGSVADAVYAAPQSEINVAVAWIGALAYLAQIYFDFSGYSDMAIGLARVFGFTYRENFEYPYTSRTVKEFWRRWHISLSTWFKEYLYIPLGGNQKGRARAVLNKLIVFGLCGLWHGASWTFVVWGLFHGLFLLLEEYLPLKRLPRVLGWAYALLVVCVGFVLFRSETFAQALFMLGQMFTGFHFEHMAVARASWMLDPFTLSITLVAIIAATPVARVVSGRLKRMSRASRPVARVASYVSHASYIGSLVLFALCLLALSGGGYNPFIYFRF
jgi:alginate O-acetyltransferase complex protein AlgI